MEITFAVQSLKPGSPWGKVVERIEMLERRPAVVLLNECRDWGAGGGWMWRRARKDLRMDALPLAASASGLGTLIMFDPEIVGEPLPAAESQTSIMHEDLTGRSYHGWAIAWFQVGLPQRLGVCSMKLTPYSALAAAIEADYVATHSQRGGQFSVIGGDVNFASASPEDLEPTWVTQYPYNIGSRAQPGTARTNPVAERAVAQRFVDNGFDDVALELAARNGDPSILKATSEFGRIDAFYASQALAGAGVWYTTLAEPEDASDHAMVAFTLDTSRVTAKAGFTWR